jgi:phage FluMu protein Com
MYYVHCYYCDTLIKSASTEVTCPKCHTVATIDWNGQIEAEITGDKQKREVEIDNEYK